MLTIVFTMCQVLYRAFYTKPTGYKYHGDWFSQGTKGYCCHKKGNTGVRFLKTNMSTVAFNNCSQQIESRGYLTMTGIIPHNGADLQNSGSQPGVILLPGDIS